MSTLLKQTSLPATGGFTFRSMETQPARDKASWGQRQPCAEWPRWALPSAPHLSGPSSRARTLSHSSLASGTNV